MLCQSRKVAAIKPNLTFFDRVKMLGRKGKTLEERIKQFPEVSYRSTAIGYETLTGNPHSRQANVGSATHSTRHTVLSVGGTPIPKGSHCHEYLALDSLGGVHEHLNKELTTPHSRLETQQIINTDELIGFSPAKFLFPNVLLLPSFWFWLFRVLTGLTALVIYIFIIFGGSIAAIFIGGGVEYFFKYYLDFYSDEAYLVFFGLTPIYYAFFKLLQLSGLSHFFDPPFMTGSALRRDLGVLRSLDKNGHTKDIPFEELEARTTTMWDGGNRAMCKLYLSHKYSKEGLVYGAPHKQAWYVGLLWEFFQHFMDVSRPLPDVPELEPYRHLDPTTREWDKQHNRPPRLWRDMDHRDYMALVRESVDSAAEYPYLKPELAKKQKWQPAGDGKHWYQLG